MERVNRVNSGVHSSFPARTSTDFCNISINELVQTTGWIWEKEGSEGNRWGSLDLNSFTKRWNKTDKAKTQREVLFCSSGFCYRWWKVGD